MRAILPALLVVISCAPVGSGASNPSVAAVYRPGVETFLADLPPAMRGARVGLISNHGAVDRSGALVIDRIAEHPDLKPLWYAIALVVATSRAHVRIHHASDVIGGIATGIVLGRLFRTACLEHEGSSPRQQADDEHCCAEPAGEEPTHLLCGIG